MSISVFFIVVGCALGLARFLSGWAPEGTAHRFFLNIFPVIVYFAAVILPLLPLFMGSGKSTGDISMRILMAWAIGGAILLILPLVLKKLLGGG